jgi:beta-phosphoglucomutase
MNTSIRGFIFDLDGVIVDTAHHHFLSWRLLAGQMGFEIPDSLDHDLKGLGRMESLEKVLAFRDVDTPKEEWADLAARKNTMYLEEISHLSAGDTLPGVIEFLESARQLGLALAIGSGSKNARPILTTLGISDRFNAICDGTDITRSKPDPEVFQCACTKLGLSPNEAVIFEDARSGVEAAKNLGAYVVGIGHADQLGDADVILPSLTGINATDILKKLPEHAA